MTTAFIFPGQGAQSVGMGKDICDAFPVARRMFDLAEKATALPLAKLCFEGPEQELSRTDICQPAIFTVSAAILAVISETLPAEKLQAIRPSFMAGLSLGEYTALYAADAIDFPEAIKLVARRGALMQQAAVAVPSGMVAVIGLDEPKAQELCAAAAEGEVLGCANFNAPGQIVLSGATAACERAAARAKDFGARGATMLKVAGAFHSSIMSPAAAGLSEAMAPLAFREPIVPVIANVDAQAHKGGSDDIKARLLAQLTGSVRWQQSMELLIAQGVTRFYEIGPGNVLAGLMRRINKGVEVVSVNSAAALTALMNS
jgi:[acyl-carrier-protein] S-malonyltransferase